MLSPATLFPSFSFACYFSVTLYIISICLLFCWKLFKPVDQWRKPPDGKPWRFPPGPRGSPIIGNMMQVLRARKEGTLPTYLSSISQFGEMTTLRMGSKTWVLLNSAYVVAELIAKHGTITSERPYFPIASGLVSRNKRTALRQTAQWAEGRRVMQNLLNGSALKNYGDWQELESIQLLGGYLYRPHQWYLHHYRYSNSIVHRIVLGERLLKSTPELVAFQTVTIEFIQTINSSIVDFFPQLASIPRLFQLWRRHWEEMGQFHYDVFQTWWKPVKQAIAHGIAPPSFVRDVLLHKDTKYSGDDEEAMYLATSIIAAGSDNTRMAMNTFVMAALCYPDVFRRAKDEIDKVCSPIDKAKRLPRLADMAKLPYICAMVKETLRWRPSVPLIPEHQLTQDLEFEGYWFPKGTNFVINCVSVSRECEEPDVFNPERWLDGTESNIIHGLWQFGGGRRICPGYKVAQQELFIAFARLIYCFDYVPAGRYDSKQLHHEAAGEPFPVRVSVRSKEHETLIVEELTRAGFLESAKVEF